MKPRSSTASARRLGADLRPVGPAADGDEDAVEGASVVVAELDLEPVFSASTAVTDVPRWIAS